MSFSPLEKNAWAGLLVAYTDMNRKIEGHLHDRFGISHPEFEILLRLSWQDGKRMRLQDLAADSILTCSGTSRAVDRLVKAGFLRRELAKEDRRGAYAALAPKGVRLIEKALDEHVEFVRKHFLDAFTEDQMRTMANHWTQLEKHQQATPVPTVSRSIESQHLKSGQSD